MDMETRFETGDKGKKIVNSSDYGVHVHVNMIAVPEQCQRRERVDSM